MIIRGELSLNPICWLININQLNTEITHSLNCKEISHLINYKSKSLTLMITPILKRILILQKRKKNQKYPHS